MPMRGLSTPTGPTCEPGVHPIAAQVIESMTAGQPVVGPLVVLPVPLDVSLSKSQLTAWSLHM
jgi:hypothetical protein